MLDAVLTEIAAAVGLGCARWVIRLAWPRVQSWLRDFAILDEQE